MWQQLYSRIKDVVEWLFFAPFMFVPTVVLCLVVFVYLPLWLMGWLPSGW